MHVVLVARLLALPDDVECLLEYLYLDVLHVGGGELVLLPQFEHRLDG